MYIYVERRLLMVEEIINYYTVWVVFVWHVETGKLCLVSTHSACGLHCVLLAGATRCAICRHKLLTTASFLQFCHVRAQAHANITTESFTIYWDSTLPTLLCVSINFLSITWSIMNSCAIEHFTLTHRQF